MIASMRPARQDFINYTKLNRQIVKCPYYHVLMKVNDDVEAALGQINILEDIVTSPVHESMTATLDSLMNLGFYDQPQTAV